MATLTSSSYSKIDLPMLPKSLKVNVGAHEGLPDTTECGMTSINWFLPKLYSATELIISFARYRYGLGDEHPCGSQLMHKPNWESYK